MAVATKQEVEVRMPRLGESVTEATITRWLKQEGERVEADEPLVEIATDKVDSEVPAPVSGILKKRLFDEGASVEVGKPFAIIEVESAVQQAESPAPTPAAATTDNGQSPAIQSTAPTPPSDGQNASAQAEGSTPATTPHPATDGQTSGGARFYSPVVLRIAQEHGISMEELARIPGTGIGGRVTKKDILRYLAQRQTQVQATTTTATPPAQTPPQQPQPQPQVQAVAPPPEPASPATTTPQKHTPPETEPPAPAISTGLEEIIEMDRVRQLIAQHMIEAKRTAAHVTSFAEADVTRLVQWRERWKEPFRQREGFPLTYTPIFVELLVQALKAFPRLNASVDGNRIILKKYYNIGIAVALPDGNLIVPVVKNADQYNLVGLARVIYDLAERARKKALKPDEIEGGTFTLTNIGSFGSLMGTPIIPMPQVAILATGAIKKRVVVIEGPDGDTIGIRHIMYLSLSYDHRIIDGALAGAFLRHYVSLLENFDVNKTI